MPAQLVCPQCPSMVNADSTFCPKCGAVFTIAEIKYRERLAQSLEKEVRVVVEPIPDSSATLPRNIGRAIGVVAGSVLGPPNMKWIVGQRVFHTTFGTGTIELVRQMEKELIVKFDRGFVRSLHAPTADKELQLISTPSVQQPASEPVAPHPKMRETTAVDVWIIVTIILSVLATTLYGNGSASISLQEVIAVFLSNIIGWGLIIGLFVFIYKAIAKR